MKVLSLFDGMGCLYMALKELGYKNPQYYASEIEKRPIQFTKQNIPGIIHLGNIENWRSWDLDWKSFDFIGAGSPCQGFSFAGKQLNFSDPRSRLFFTFVDILNHVKKNNPDVKFLLENVNMKREYLRIISEYLGIFPVRINSNLVSAQNRDRWYWTNIRTKDVGLFSELWTDIPQPKDRGILLKDILQLESEIDEKYYLSEKRIKGMSIAGKSKTQRSSTGNCTDEKHNYQIINVKGIKKPNQNKSSCFMAGGNSGGNHSDMDVIYVAMRGRNPENPNDRRTGNPTKQRLEAKTDGKANLLLQKPHGFNKGGDFEDKSPTLLSNSWEHNNHVSDGFKLRRLTPIECAQLQTIPEWVDFSGFSDTAIYKMLGNGWTVEVIKHILTFLK